MTYLPGCCGCCGVIGHPAVKMPGTQCPVLWCACAMPANPVTANMLRANPAISDFSFFVSPEF